MIFVNIQMSCCDGWDWLDTSSDWDRQMSRQQITPVTKHLLYRRHNRAVEHEGCLEKFAFLYLIDPNFPTARTVC